MSFILTLSSMLSLQVIWRMSTEILHHHPNSTMEDYNNIYERLKHSGVRHYLLVCHLVNLITSQRSFGLFLFSWSHLSFISPLDLSGTCLPPTAPRSDWRCKAAAVWSWKLEVWEGVSGSAPEDQTDPGLQELSGLHHLEWQKVYAL